ncbi:MAG: formylglycine-generating enzyme family protein [Bradymonadia bacterium]
MRWALLLLCLWGCDSNTTTSGDDPTDAVPFPDSALLDMGVVDVGLTDAQPRPDASMIPPHDGGVTQMDAGQLDGALSDFDLPDIELADAEVPDGAASDAILLDGEASDAAQPDAEALPPPWVRWDQDRVRIPAGFFVRGSRLPVHPEREKPQRAIEMSAFEIHRDEVSLRAWADCVEAGACEVPGDGSGCTWPLRDSAPRLPVTCVSRDQARAYCVALGGDLPTEAQWEYAARGACNQRGDGVCEQGIDDPDFPWPGPELGCRQARSQLCPDWSEGPEQVWWRSPDGDSIFGVRNMGGNVAEWVLDDYVEDAYVPVEGDALDPVVIQPGTPGIVRGGHYATPGVQALRVAHRQPADPATPRPEQGVRCAFPAAP